MLLVIAAIMVFTLLDLRVDANLPLMRVCKRVTQGMRMVKYRFDDEWEFSAGRIRCAAKVPDKKLFFGHRVVHVTKPSDLPPCGRSKPVASCRRNDAEGSFRHDGT